MNRIIKKPPLPKSVTIEHYIAGHAFFIVYDPRYSHRAILAVPAMVAGTGLGKDAVKELRRLINNVTRHMVRTKDWSTDERENN